MVLEGVVWLFLHQQHLTCPPSSTVQWMFGNVATVGWRQEVPAHGCCLARRSYSKAPHSKTTCNLFWCMNQTNTSIFYFLYLWIEVVNNNTHPCGVHENGRQSFHKLWPLTVNGLPHVPVGPRSPDCVCCRLWFRDGSVPILEIFA